MAGYVPFSWNDVFIVFINILVWKYFTYLSPKCNIGFSEMLAKCRRTFFAGCLPACYLVRNEKENERKMERRLRFYKVLLKKKKKTYKGSTFIKRNKGGCPHPRLLMVTGAYG